MTARARNAIASMLPCRLPSMRAAGKTPFASAARQSRWCGNDYVGRRKNITGGNGGKALTRQPMAIGTSPKRTPYPRSTLQRFAVLLAVILQIGATFLSSLGIGEDIGSRSDATRTLITPAGWAFAIWGPLFAGSALFAIYQALPSQRYSALLNRIAWPTAGAFALNGLWHFTRNLRADDRIRDHHRRFAGVHPHHLPDTRSPGS